MNLLSQMRISHKISSLMVGLVLGFIAIGVAYYVQITVESRIRAVEQEAFQFQHQVYQLNLKRLQMQAVAKQFLTTGKASLLNQRETLFNEANSDLQSLMKQSQKYQSQQYVQQLTALLKEYDSMFQSAVAVPQARGMSTSSHEITSAAESAYTAEATTKYESGTDDVWEPRLDALELSMSETFTRIVNATTAIADRVLADSAGHKKLIQTVVTAIIFIVAVGTAVGIYLIYKSIVFPMVHIQSVIRKINKGQTHSRVKLQTEDELGDLGKAFNKLFDERIQQLEAQSRENERLNNSIISLIKSLGMIAKKDLTIKVPVSADITGTVSDAVNLLTTETAKTLHQVKAISEDVNQVSNQLQAQSTRVIQFADSEKKQILTTSKALDILARAMSEVAKRAEDTNQTANEAIENTRMARQSVEETVNGIRTIRETIAETEKRTKRLGDRSQEISGIVSLINTIAERTHILALNASMHAASAGEAGKGFAVVADEVQRLAENARQSTDDIAAMVNNMRVETADTVNIMSTLITQVAEGSRKAEQAGQQMSTTETATKKLVENVKYIAEQAVQQAEVATRVRDRSAVIRSLTDKTGQQLAEQKQQTERLKICADTLLERVNVFTLPEDSVDSSPKVLHRTEANPATADAVSPLHAAS
jgi:twitching motility protein PilJ